MPQNVSPVVTVASSGASPTVVQNVHTITAHTGTYDVGMAANPARKFGGAVCASGTAALKVYFGPHATAAATAGIGVTIPIAGVLYLDTVFPNDIYTGEVAVAGTTLDVYSTIENS